MSQNSARNGKMGTFGGVFTPSVLTILGLILFLRLGYVVGLVGLGQVLLIIALASGVSILTSISLSAVATNLEVKGGGVYYIISRTLGVAFGGAIGLVLFVALAVSAGFYCVGFAEGVSALLSVDNPLVRQAIAAAAVVIMVAIALVGAEWATRIQYLVMALLAAALVSFSMGAFGSLDLGLLGSNLLPVNGWSDFWVAFAIFFPAVTGFTQGVNMSGDLADPQTSIPRGTAAAVAVSIVIYAGAAVLLAATLTRGTLLADYGAMRSVASFAPFIDAGIIAATLSSALASLMGAPRILQSLARDSVFPLLAPFAKGHGSDANPRRGILLGGGIALAVVALGNLNLIASVVSMFFVVTYGLLNYATYYEARARSPSFRPALRWFHPYFSLAGGLLCLAVILAINLIAGLAAILVVYGIFQYLKLNSRQARWADGQRSYHLQIVRDHLREAGSRAEHPRDWRPQILAFSDDPERRERLLIFAGWIEGHSGMTTVVRILEGKGRRARRDLAAAEVELVADLTRRGLTAFPLVVTSVDLDVAVPVAVQSVGIGPTRINTVLVNWIEKQTKASDDDQERRFVSNLHASQLLGCNLLVLDAEEPEWLRLDQKPPRDRIIDVWWQDTPTGRLMLVLAYLLTRNDRWKGASIRLLAVDAAATPDRLQQQLEKIVQEVRIPAVVIVVPAAGQHAEPIVAASAASDIVFMGLAIRDQRFTDWLGGQLAPLLPKLPVTVLALAGEEIELDTDPDDHVEVPEEHSTEEAAGG